MRIWSVVQAVHSNALWPIFPNLNFFPFFNWSKYKDFFPSNSMAIEEQERV